MGELTGMVAIVTGASKGIGAAIARAFATAGAAVAVNYASSKADADRVVGEIVKAGGKAVAIQADVAKRADLQRLFRETMEKLGRPSILVNNAGVYRMDPLESVTEEDFHRQFNTNVLGAILAAQEAVKAFNGSGGSIINFSTIWTTDPVPRLSGLSASKSAVDAVARTLAIELAGKGIRVNAIAPGPTETEGLAAFGVTAESGESDGLPELPDGAAQPARRHCARGALSCLRPGRLGDRGTHFGLWRRKIWEPRRAHRGKRSRQRARLNHSQKEVEDGRSEYPQI